MRRTIIGGVLIAAMLLPMPSMAAQKGTRTASASWWRALLAWVAQATGTAPDRDDVLPTASVIIDPNG